MTSLSNSDPEGGGRSVPELVTALLAAGDHGAGLDGLSREQAASLLALASATFGRLEDPYRRDVLARLYVQPTAACTAAAALLRSQSLTPFEFNVWFSQARITAADEPDPAEEA